MPANSPRGAKKGESAEILLRALKSGIIGYIVFIALCCIFALILLKSDLSDENSALFGFLSLAVSALLCGALSVGKLKTRAVITGLCSSVFLLMPVYLTELIANGSDFGAKALIAVPAAVLFSMCGAILKKNKRRKR